jgi:hypothetical protein
MKLAMPDSLISRLSPYSSPISRNHGQQTARLAVMAEDISGCLRVKAALYRDDGWWTCRGQTRDVSTGKLWKDTRASSNNVLGQSHS